MRFRASGSGAILILDAVESFIADPTESTFARVDVAGQALRDVALSGEFAQVGSELFDADGG